MHRKGYNDVIQIPSCELWLKIISMLFGKGKSFLVYGKQEVIEDTIGILRADFEE